MTPPSALDDEFEHLLDARLVDLSCQPDTLTAHNRLALRAGRRVSTSVIQAALSQTRQHPVELGYAKCDLHVSGLGSHPSRPGARATPSPGSDEPPPF